MTILQNVKRTLQALDRNKIISIAYSGGIDSHVLLHACYLLREELGLKLQALHINHGLSKNANAWQEHCRDICAQYHIHFESHCLTITKVAGESLEALARERRYLAFQQLMSEQSILLTAHHQDDQAETLLMQLSRGAGLAGLSAMPKIKQNGRLLHVRPLLELTREEIKCYAEHYQLTWVEDESNTSLKRHRNHIRHRVLPALKEFLPNVHASIARSASHCADAHALLDEWACHLLTSMRTKNNTLRMHDLSKLTELKQALLLRAWITQNGYVLPSSKKLHIIIQNVLKAKDDRNPCVSFGDCEIRRYQSELYLLPKSLKDYDSNIYAWDLKTNLLLPRLGQLAVTRTSGGGLKILPNVKVQCRRGGERLYINGQHRTLKNCFQEWRIPVWERDRVPLIFYQNDLICVVNHFMDVRYRAHDNEPGLQLKLIPLVE